MYRAVNTLYLGYKNSQLMLCREIAAVCFEIHIKPVSTLFGRKVEFFSVKPGSAYSLVITQR